MLYTFSLPLFLFFLQYITHRYRLSTVFISDTDRTFQNITGLFEGASSRQGSPFARYRSFINKPGKPSAISGREARTDARTDNSSSIWKSKRKNTVRLKQNGFPRNMLHICKIVGKTIKVYAIPRVTCVKGGGAAYAVTEGFSCYNSQKQHLGQLRWQLPLHKGAGRSADVSPYTASWAECADSSLYTKEPIEVLTTTLIQEAVRRDCSTARPI